MSAMVLIVEDEPEIRELIRMNLEASGFLTEGAEDGLQALESVRRRRPDCILLDWMMPVMNGLKCLTTLKADAELCTIPVLMLTAKGEEDDIVRGLEAGAADYVTKPFSNKVLIARVKALLRREDDQPHDAILQYLSLQISPDKRVATLDGDALSLTCGEFDLLHLLCKRPGRVYTRAQIVSYTKGDAYPVTDRAVDVQILNLRRKLGSFGDYLETVRGVGYRMRSAQ